MSTRSLVESVEWPLVTVICNYTAIWWQKKRLMELLVGNNNNSLWLPNQSTACTYLNCRKRLILRKYFTGIINLRNMTMCHTHKCVIKICFFSSISKISTKKLHGFNWSGWKYMFYYLVSSKQEHNRDLDCCYQTLLFNILWRKYFY